MPRRKIPLSVAGTFGLASDTAHRPALLSVHEAQRELGNASHTLVYSLMKKGDLERVKLGRATRITRRSIDALIERQSEGRAA